MCKHVVPHTHPYSRREAPLAVLLSSVKQLWILHAWMQTGWSDVQRSSQRSTSDVLAVFRSLLTMYIDFGWASIAARPVLDRHASTPAGATNLWREFEHVVQIPLTHLACYAEILKPIAHDDRTIEALVEEVEGIWEFVSTWMTEDTAVSASTAYGVTLRSTCRKQDHLPSKRQAIEPDKNSTSTGTVLDLWSYQME